MNLKDKIIATGLAGVMSLGMFWVGKAALTDYQISKNAVASASWYTAQGFIQHYAGAFDDNHDGTIDRILLRDVYFGAHCIAVSSQEIRPADPRFNDLLSKIKK